jgi:hypothetical protein
MKAKIRVLCTVLADEPQISTACSGSCDTQAMTCQSACVVVGPTAGTPLGRPVVA